MDETYIPHMNSGNGQAGQAVSDPVNVDAWANARQAQASMPTENRANGAPVVGFLYTLSNNNQAEFWPLHIGTNRIGTAADCDVRLAEKTVSDHHCEILVRLQRKGDRLIAGIRDSGSSNGTLLNDEDLNYDMHNCVSEDVITVGFNYRMVLLLVDPAKYGLGAAPDFQATAQQMPPMPNMPDMNATHQRNVNVNINMNETQPDIPSSPISGGGTAIF